MKRRVRLALFLGGIVAVLVGAFMSSLPLGIATTGAVVAWFALQLERSDT